MTLKKKPGEKSKSTKPKKRAVKKNIIRYQQEKSALQESENRYKQLLGSVTDYIYSVQVQDGHPVSTVH